MKLRTLLPAFLMVCGIALGAASHANADYVLWTPTTSNDQNVFSLNLTPQNCTMPGDLYISAVGATQGIGNSGNAVLLANLESLPVQATDFTIAQTNGVWYVYSGDAVLPISSALLTLGSTNSFALYYNYGGVLQPTIADVSGQPDDWQLTSGIPGCPLTVLLVDAAPNPEVGSPAPIPGTFLLFGPGLAGALGFLRRFSS